MKDNKLIAEFMGMKYSDERSFNDGEWTHSIKSLSKFETSWDWLMPVISKCRSESNSEDSHWEVIYYTLEEGNLNASYEAVVQFINNQNN